MSSDVSERLRRIWEYREQQKRAAKQRALPPAKPPAPAPTSPLNSASLAASTAELQKAFAQLKQQYSASLPVPVSVPQPDPGLCHQCNQWVGSMSNHAIAYHASLTTTATGPSGYVTCGACGMMTTDMVQHNLSVHPSIATTNASMSWPSNVTTTLPGSFIQPLDERWLEEDSDGDRLRALIDVRAWSEEEVRVLRFLAERLDFVDEVESDILDDTVRHEGRKNP